MKVILGSSSKFRKRIFSQIINEFESMSPDVDEKAVRDSDPKILTVKIATAKGDALVKKIPEPAILVTADQVVVVGGEIREKPSSEEEARNFLRTYADRSVEVVNGIVVTNTKTGKRVEGNDVVSISFKSIPEEVIEELLRNGDIMFCGGALQAESPLLAPYILSRAGTDESLQGVPVDLIRRLMAEVVE